MSSIIHFSHKWVGIALYIKNNFIAMQKVCTSISILAEMVWHALIGTYYNGMTMEYFLTQQRGQDLFTELEGQLIAVFVGIKLDELKGLKPLVSSDEGQTRDQLAG